MMNNINRPSYLVDFNASICNFEILINDMPAFLQHEGGSIISQYPINSFLYRSGDQEIKIRILPLKGEKTLRSDGSVKIKVQFYDLGSDPDQATTVFAYETPDLSAAKLPLIEVRQLFKAEIPYEQPAWAGSVVLDTDQATIEKATLLYKKVYELIKAKDYPPFLELMEQRLREVDQSTYTLNSDNVEEWNELMQQVKQSEMVLADFPSELSPRLYGHGRVLNLRREDGSTVIKFINDKHEEFQFPIFVHRKTKDSPFAIIR